MTKILIVDDSPAELHQVSAVLERHGYQVVTADNGADGVAICCDEMPDAVLMDVVMPELNGFQATRQLSKNPETQNIPVIIITAKDQETDRVWGMRQGAKNYLVKPVSEEKLLSSLNEVLA